MNKYINMQTGRYPMSMHDIRSENPNISMPTSIDDGTLKTLGYQLVVPTAMPDVPFGAKAIEIEPQLKDGVYYATYEIVPLDADESQAAIVTKQKNLTDGVQHLLDEQARAMGYDNIITASTYVASSVEKFKHEAAALIAWRDTVWVACYAILGEVLAGNRQIPTLDELLAELPKFEVISSAQ